MTGLPSLEFLLWRTHIEVDYINCKWWYESNLRVHLFFLVANVPKIFVSIHGSSNTFIIWKHYKMRLLTTKVCGFFWNKLCLSSIWVCFDWYVSFENCDLKLLVYSFKHSPQVCWAFVRCIESHEDKTLFRILTFSN